MLTSYDIVLALLRTEKSAFLEPERKYVFQVSRKANKIQIRQAVEEIYKVKVSDVNTSSVVGKLKRVRTEMGKTSAWKKAVVTLHVGQKIEVT